VIPTVIRRFVNSFDEAADSALERLRGRRIPDTVFRSASHVGDFSLLWHAIALVRLVGRRDRLASSVGLSLALGAESLIVNQGIKRLFERTRPTVAGDDRYPVRRPSTSAFPSGHASSAFFAATILTAAGPRRLAPLWLFLATIVATSRAYVRIHHPSDVVGGAFVGLALGVLGRSILRTLGVITRR
jgi:membrane-associated phospholipid phosphatase